MRRTRDARLTTVLAFVLGLVVATAGTATAAKLITGKQIQDGSISAKDLNKAVRAQLAKAGVAGPKGDTGARGEPGAKGDQGIPGPVNDGAVTNAKLADGAVDSAKVADFGLRLHDLGGLTNDGTRATSADFTVAAGTCSKQGLGLFNPAPNDLIGSLVVGYLTDAQGGAVLNNAGVVVPTVISETSQGGAIPNLVVCGSSAQSVPAGSVFHYRIIGP